MPFIYCLRIGTRPESGHGVAVILVCGMSATTNRDSTISNILMQAAGSAG